MCCCCYINLDVGLLLEVDEGGGCEEDCQCECNRQQKRYRDQRKKMRRRLIFLNEKTKKEVAGQRTEDSGHVRFSNCRKANIGHAEGGIAV